MPREYVFHKFECGGGARWTSPEGSPSFEDAAGRVCNFSGCNCGTIVRFRGTTVDRKEAHDWFRRPK